MYITSTTLAVPHLPNLEVAIHMSRIAELEPTTITRRGVAQFLPACLCPVMHSPIEFVHAAKAAGGLETKALMTYLETGKGRLGIVMTRVDRDVAAVMLDLGRLGQLGVVDHAIRNGRLPLMLSTSDGLHQQLVMPLVTGGIVDMLEAGRDAQPMTPVAFVELAGQCIRAMVEPESKAVFDLDVAELKSLSVSICLSLGNVASADGEPSSPGTVH
jgi:hypothetical protein